MYRVIGLDPGGTTGWATYTAEYIPNPNTTGPADRYEFHSEEWACGQLGPGPHHDALWSFLELQAVSQTVIACESFEFRQGKQRAGIVLDSCEYIGIVKLFVEQRQRSLPNNFRMDLVMKTAGQAKSFITDDKIKKLGLWYPGHRHAMDAYRHLLHFLLINEQRHDIARRLK